MSQSTKMILLYGIVLFLDVLEMTLLNVGLPSIANALRIPNKEIDIVVTAFIWGLTLMIPLAGWLGQRYGNKRVFIWGQLLFTGASIGCFCAQSLFQLTLFRIIQGFGGGLIMPVGLALLMNMLSMKERATATAKLSLILRLAPALGPILGGYTLACLGWRWLFLLKLPIAGLCLLASFLWLKTNHEKQEIKRFDFKGLAFCSTCLGSLLMAMSGLGPIQTGLWSSIGIISFLLFIKAERKAEAPIIPLQLFKSRLFCQSNLLQSLAFCMILGSTFLFSLFLQGDLEFNPTVTGWVLASSTAGMFLAIPVVSIFYKRLGPKPLVMTGFILLGLSLTAIACLKPSASPWLASIFMISLGLGNSIIVSTNATTVFTEIPKELMGSASSVYSLTRQMANCFGVALSGSLLAMTANSSLALILMLPLVFIGIILGYRIDNKKVLEGLSN